MDRMGAKNPIIFWTSLMDAPKVAAYSVYMNQNELCAFERLIVMHLMHLRLLAPGGSKVEESCLLTSAILLLSLHSAFCVDEFRTKVVKLALNLCSVLLIGTPSDNATQAALSEASKEQEQASKK